MQWLLPADRNLHTLQVLVERFLCVFFYNFFLFSFNRAVHVHFTVLVELDAVVAASCRQ